MSDNSKHCATEQDYTEAIESAGDRLVVVHCCSERGEASQQFAPVYETLAQEHPSVLFLVLDMDRFETSNIGRMELGAWKTPTFVFLRDGNKLGSIQGADESALRKGIANGGNVNGICSSCSIQ